MGGTLKGAWTLSGRAGWDLAWPPRPTQDPPAAPRASAHPGSFLAPLTLSLRLGTALGSVLAVSSKDGLTCPFPRLLVSFTHGHSGGQAWLAVGPSHRTGLAKATWAEFSTYVKTLTAPNTCGCVLVLRRGNEYMGSRRCIPTL